MLAPALSAAWYLAGTDPLTAAAIAARGPVEEFLRQRVDDPSTVADAEPRLVELASYGELATLPDPVAVVAAPAPAGAPGTPLGAAIPPLSPAS
jgi:hypothetical protein